MKNQTKIRWLIDGQAVSQEASHDSNYVQLMRHDQQSWTLRSNLTFVINTRQPTVRSVVCIGKLCVGVCRSDLIDWDQPRWWCSILNNIMSTAYSESSGTEIVSATHRISVICKYSSMFYNICLFCMLFLFIILSISLQVFLIKQSIKDECIYNEVDYESRECACDHLIVLGLTKCD